MRAHVPIPRFISRFISIIVTAIVLWKFCSRTTTDRSTKAIQLGYGSRSLFFFSPISSRGKNSKRWREKKKRYVNKKTSSIWKLYIQIGLLEWRLKRKRRENVSSLYSRTILRELASVIIFSHFDASTSKRQKSSRAKPTCCSWVKIQATNERAAQRTRKVSRAYEWFDV